MCVHVTFSLSPSLTLLKRPVYSAWKLCGVLNAKCQSVSARRPFSSGLLGDETSDLAVCIRHLGVCDWACMCVCVCLCGHAINGCVCFSRYLCKDGYCMYGRESEAVRGGVYSLTDYHVNTLCFVSTCLCQTRGPLFPLPRLKRHSGQTPTWYSSVLATIHQEFSSTDTPVGLILIQTICTGISGVGEESVCGSDIGRLRSDI